LLVFRLLSREFAGTWQKYLRDLTLRRIISYHTEQIHERNFLPE
jgi:hypothetical protein